MSSNLTTCVTRLWEGVDDVKSTVNAQARNHLFLAVRIPEVGPSRPDPLSGDGVHALLGGYLFLRQSCPTVICFTGSHFKLVSPLYLMIKIISSSNFFFAITPRTPTAT